MTLLLSLYRGFAQFPGPLLAKRLLAIRVRRGKEDPARVGERQGETAITRPDGPLVWLHAASVGESLSLLPLIDVMRQERPDLALLVTTGTRSSAALMAERLPAGVVHQFAPVDTRPAIAAFLDHWRPEFLGVAESEIWPTMLSETRARGATIALLSARLSERSARGWRRAPRSAKALLGLFDMILPQTEQIRERLISIGAAPTRMRVVGSLKSAAQPLPVDQQDLTALSRALGDRPLWLAASTHAGEETAALQAHLALKARTARILSLIVPRHPERADQIAQELEAAGLRVARRSITPIPPADAGVFIVDAFGELGLWYRLAPIAFVGGSLAALGGHNPQEPARLNTAVMFGPHVDAFASECADLLDAGAALQVDDAEGLSATLLNLTTADGAPNQAARAMAAAGSAAMARGSRTAAEVFDAITPLLPPRRAPRSPSNTVAVNALAGETTIGPTDDNAST